MDNLGGECIHLHPTPLCIEGMYLCVCVYMCERVCVCMSMTGEYMCEGMYMYVCVYV